MGEQAGGWSQPLELAWQDVILSFLHRAAREPQTASIVHLAGALGRFFTPCHIMIFSLPVMPSGHLVEAASWRNRQGAFIQPPNEAKVYLPELNQARSELPETGTRALDVRFGPDQGDTLALILARRIGEGLDQLWELGILLRDLPAAYREQMRRRFIWLRRYAQGLEALATTYDALFRTHELNELAQGVAEFVKNEEATAVRRLEGGCDLLERVRRALQVSPDPELLLQAEEIGEAALQRLVGNGWDFRKAEGKNLADLAAPFLAVWGKIQQDAVAFEPLLCRRLRALTCVFQALAGHDQTSEIIDDLLKLLNELPEDRRDFGLDERALLALWSAVHQEALELVRDGDDWKTWHNWRGGIDRIEQSLGFLQVVLAARFQRDLASTAASLRVKMLPAWLRLWFCHALLCEAISHAEEDSATWRRPQLWAHLAYVARETLRALLYGRRADYQLQPQELSVALRTLVEHHALHVVCLPSDPDIRSLLYEVSQMHEGGGYLFAAGHLQHVLEVYIAGQFLCEVQVPVWGKDEKIWTFQEILASRSAWKPGSLPQREFRKAFSLAALLHDIGQLLLPHWPQPHTRWAKVDKMLMQNLEEARIGLQETVTELTRRCADELRRSGIFDPHAEPAVEDWITSLLEKNTADPAVVSAWFLHRLCQNIADLQPNTARQAVRAVLLHRLVTQEIHTDMDPAAALLVLCDQIFTWQAARGAIERDVGHSVQTLAADVKPPASPFRLLKMKAQGEQATMLSLSTDRKSRRLIGCLSGVNVRRDRRDEDYDLWPCFTLHLRPPETLDVTVLQIWLSMAQNLGRIVPSRRYQWAPQVTIRSEIANSKALKTFELLRRIASRSTVRPSLERWLDSIREIKGHRVDGLFEEITLGPRAPLRYRGDICDALPELDRLAEEILRS